MGYLLSLRVKYKSMMTTTENSTTNAWNLNLSDGNQNGNNKSQNRNRVRAVAAYSGQIREIFIKYLEKIFT